MDALVLQLNHITYAECGGKVMDIACGSDTDILGDYWGVPVKDGGFFRGYNIQKGAAAPTPDSIPLVRLVDKINGNSIHVLGTVAQWRTACDGGAAMPGSATIPIVVPETTPCVGADGNYTWHFGVPAKEAGQTYTVAVMYNNTQAVAPGTGLTAIGPGVGSIIEYLTTNYAAVGTWTNDGGRIKLVRATTAKVGLTINVV